MFEIMEIEEEIDDKQSPDINKDSHSDMLTLVGC